MRDDEETEELLEDAHEDALEDTAPEKSEVQEEPVPADGPPKWVEMIGPMGRCNVPETNVDANLKAGWRIAPKPPEPKATESEPDTEE